MSPDPTSGGPPDGPDHGFADEGGRYRLDSRIATGGMGEVWRGTDTVLGREVAIKLLKHEYADDASFRSRFETEARHAGSLHHPGIAAVFDFGEGSGIGGSGARPFLVMELVDGQPLSALLRPGEPMDPDAARDLLGQAAAAVGAAHAAGIVHRDIKPANLLVTPDRRVKITDFGIARAADAMAITQTGQVMGTPQYLSPEQARGNAATPASDVYALGVVAFECLAGRRPFVADSPVATALAHLREPVPALPPEVPADLAAVVRKALSKEPHDRFADGAAFATALRDPATAATAIVPPPTDGDHTQVLAGAAGAAGLGAAGLAGAAAAEEAPPTSAGPAAGPTEGAAGGAGTPGGGRRRAVLWLLLAALAVLLVIVIGFVVLARTGDDTTPTPNPTPTGKHHRHTPSPQPTRSASTTAPSPTESSSSSPTESPSASPSSTAPTSPTGSPSTSAPSSPSTSPSASTSSSPTTSPTTPASPSASATPTASAPASRGSTAASGQSPAPATSSPSTAGSTSSRRSVPADDGKVTR
ncbi:protein kinase domain-containing protein [Nocardioides panaciterrulae]|uniref:non-specific serine/threonine protein kinase n=1 Tax=Nocardioides panaciterrulae TaxID=661492 RepID=A0A7Y9E2W7_9ACTN|nr:serine/threonine-protein kinase [Nocardioides panaciterrulae]